MYIFCLYELFNLVQDPIGPLQLFHNVFKSATLPDGWYFRCTDKDEIQCFYVTRQSIDAAPMVMSRILIINKNLSWVVYINNHLISPSNDFSIYSEHRCSPEFS